MRIYYEIHEGDADGVKRLCMCGSVADAMMMMDLAHDKNRSFVRVEETENEDTIY